MVGVHTPEQADERVLENVRKKVVENEMEYPIAVDPDSQTWATWANHTWPSVYLIDKRGNIRTWWYGELNWQGAEGERLLREKIEALLKEDE